jgi:hypothetical protein
MSHTKGELHCHDLDIHTWRAVNDKVVEHTCIASMNESSQLNDEANAKELVRRWNAFEEDGLVADLLEACKLGLESMKGLLEIGVKIGASNKNKRLHAKNIKQVEAAIAKAKKE